MSKDTTKEIKAKLTTAKSAIDLGIIKNIPPEAIAEAFSSLVEDYISVATEVIELREKCGLKLVVEVPDETASERSE